MEATILAIETSCDETGLAVLRRRHGEIEVLSAAVASQIDIHRETGGVVPEVAAREHVSVMRPLLEKVLRDAGLREADSTRGRVDAIAVTVGPGLMPALAVGVQTARTLAYAWDKPIVPVHHIEGHVYSALLNTESEIENKESLTLPPPAGGSPSGRGRTPTLHNSLFVIPDSSLFPALALIVSGGHTMLIRISDHLRYKVLGQTRDDAAGEAFDKVGRLLDLPYPGGPAISKLAAEGNPTAFDFPRPMINTGDLNFSFSGLKTAVFYTLRDMSKQKIERHRADIAASFQQAVVDVLVSKTAAAARQMSPRVVLLAGGVAANQLLRQQLNQAMAKQNISLRIAPRRLCGDNAEMIGQAGLFAFESGRRANWQDVDAVARIDLEHFSTASQQV